MSNDCEHDKVYANITLTSNPPQHPWICRKCGERGTDQGTILSNEYDELVKQFENKKEK